MDSKWGISTIGNSNLLLNTTITETCTAKETLGDMNNKGVSGLSIHCTMRRSCETVQDHLTVLLLAEAVQHSE